MARYRIKQRPSYSTPGQAIFVVEERWLLWWEDRGLYLSLEGAEKRIEELRPTTPVQTKIVKEYDR
jgi:hypothetical protein